MPTRRNALALVAAAALLTPGAVLARQPEIYAGIVPGVAIAGYDPVAYHSEGRPVRGLATITARHGGAEWRFASEANRTRFRADPARYLPRFGGYCAWAVSQGYTAPGDPRAWRIVEGQLYLNYDRAVQRRWEEDIRGNVARGAANWPAVLSR